MTPRRQRRGRTPASAAASRLQREQGSELRPIVAVGREAEHQ
jgi:hypothetical protein